LSCIIDAKIHREAINLGETIKEENNASLHDRAKAMIFICHHLSEGLKVEYLNNKRSSCFVEKSKRKKWPLKVYHTSSNSLWLVALEVARF